MPQTVLLIDDSPVLAKLVEARLGDEPIQLHYASDGVTGIEMARQIKPDLILLDVEMPVIDGFETCRRLKLDSELLSIPIIFLSGATGTAEKILGLELGAVDYVIKPFDAAELRARVRSALRLRRLSELLAVKARVDAVTGLWNEGYFDARLAAEVNLADRASRPAGVVLCDIDRFRKLNSEHGPWFGDEVLRAVAEVLAANARQEDVVCRVNSATLGVVCPSSTVAGVVAMSHRLQAGIRGLRFSPHGAEVNITASFGVAGTEQRARTLGGAVTGIAGAFALRHAARCALDAAKSGGRDRIVIADPAYFSSASGLPQDVLAAPIQDRRRSIMGGSAVGAMGLATTTISPPPQAANPTTQAA